MSEDKDTKNEPDVDAFSGARKYLADEQPQRRQEIENLIQRIEADRRYGLLATASVWSWLVVFRDKVVPPFDLIAIFLSPIVILFLMWRWKHLDAAVHRIAEYMREVEVRFDVAADGLGWQTWLDAKRKSEKKPRDDLAISNDVYWWLLFIVNAILAGLFFWFTRFWLIDPNQ